MMADSSLLDSLGASLTLGAAREQLTARVVPVLRRVQFAFEIRARLIPPLQCVVDRAKLTSLIEAVCADPSAPPRAEMSLWQRAP